MFSLTIICTFILNLKGDAWQRDVDPDESKTEFCHYGFFGTQFTLFNSPSIYGKTVEK